MKEEIKKWVVNDYFTPNIKAEVILDTLLTPYITEIVQSQCGLGEIKFVTKEMSIKDGREDDRGKKIDYILADNDCVYMVELKTTKGSIGKNQWEDYFEYCRGDGKNFGSVFGEKLIKIGNRLAGKKPENIYDSRLDECEKTWNERVEDIFFAIADKSKVGNMKNKDGSYAEKAKEILKKKGWGSTWKYLYTMGQLLDYYDISKDTALWEKQLKLIYITPDGGSIVSKNYSPQKEKKIWEEFYVSPGKRQYDSVSLKESVFHLKEMYGNDDEYVGLVCGIISEIYEEEGEET